jgi:O-antigen/teichoic acid export membrane protein
MFGLLAAVLALIINAIANWFLVPSYGAAGAAMGSALAFFIFFAIRTEASAKLWMGFERWCMYGFMSVLLALSLVVNLVDLGMIQIAIYSTVLVVALVAFKSQSKQVYCFVFNRFI